MAVTAQERDLIATYIRFGNVQKHLSGINVPGSIKAVSAWNMSIDEARKAVANIPPQDVKSFSETLRQTGPDRLRQELGSTRVFKDSLAAYQKQLDTATIVKAPPPEPIVKPSAPAPAQGGQPPAKQPPAPPPKAPTEAKPAQTGKPLPSQDAGTVSGNPQDAEDLKGNKPPTSPRPMLLALKERQQGLLANMGPPPMMSSLAPQGQPAQPNQYLQNSQVARAGGLLSTIDPADRNFAERFVPYSQRGVK